MNKHKIGQVLIDGGVVLIISTLKLVKILGYFEYVIDISRRIVIKAYDDVEPIVFPIQVGLKFQENLYHVLDLELG